MLNFRDNLQKCQEYVHALEEEKKKIEVFQRELPLCLELVTQAIEACKQQLSGTTTTPTECFNGHYSECSEQTTSNGPILDEFIPIKKTNSCDDDDEDHDCDEPHINNMDQDGNDNDHDESNEDDNSGQKCDWLRSVQLWNQTPDLPTNQEDHQPKIVSVVEVKKNGGGAFHPFQKEKHNSSNVNVNGNGNGNGNENESGMSKPSPKPAVSACSSAEAGGSGTGSGGSSKKGEKGGQSSQRKQRRCWSPELHRRFLHALQQLGGSHAATPKQIRELMKVDGLTNDEVKSHLQKYRLHTRRPSSNAHNNATPQTPQFVVVGGIWVPPPEYAAVATSGDATNATAAPTSNTIYAPVAAVGTPPALQQASNIVTQRQQPKQSNQSRCDDRGSRSEVVHSKSPSTSSSTHTTACPAY